MAIEKGFIGFICQKSIICSLSATLSKFSLYTGKHHGEARLDALLPTGQLLTAVVLAAAASATCCVRTGFLVSF